MVLTSHDTLDPVSDAPDAHTDDTRRFRSDEAPQRQLATTLKLSDVKAGDFDAIFYPGGHGPLWDLAEDAHNRRLIAFRHAQGADGRKLVAGKRVTERGLVQLGRPRRHPRHGPESGLVGARRHGVADAAEVTALVGLTRRARCTATVTRP